MKPEVPADPFAVPGWLDWLGGWVARRPRLFARLGDLETRMLDDRIATVAVRSPIYVCGMARSGSTILLELLAGHPDTVTHRIRDFPLVHAPVLWNRFLDRAQRAPAAAVERAHGDGLLVTPESPEAVEEVLWMSFFPLLHHAGASDVLDAGTQAPAFERFYTEHLRKLLWLRGGRRYLAKGNYNSTRLDYLLRLFPDARFVIPVREPVAHVASLLRQHQRFCERHARDARSLRYMQRLGHFEFGLDRRVVHTDPDEAAAIARAWEQGREIEGLALAWNALYRFVADRLDASPALRAASCIVRHEALCAAPVDSLQRLFAHCGLDLAPAQLAALAARTRQVPEPGQLLTDAQGQTIRSLTAGTAARLGY